MAGKPPQDDGTDRQGLTRRRFVEGMGATTLVGSAGHASATADDGPTRQITQSPTATMDTTAMSLGGRLIVGEGGFSTITSAWDAAADGDTIYVHSSYDAQAAGEQFPIVLDYEQKEVTLTGGHPSGSVIDAGDTDENVIEVLGRGHNDYRNNPMVQNLKIIGGDIGLRIRAAPYSSYKDLVIWQTGSHAVSVEGYTDETGARKGSFGITFRNVMAWNCGENGFNLETDANTHSTSFFGCHAEFNGDFGVQMRGYSTRFYGGTIQNNGGYGVDARSGCGQVLHGVYFEGTGTREDTPLEVFVTGSSPGFSVETCYFQGHYARDFENGRENGYAAVAFNGSPHGAVKNCTYRNYESSFLLAIDTADLDVHQPSHCPLDETVFLETNDAERTRSNGTIQETDLRTVEGTYRGDVAIHNGDGEALWGLCLWDGAEWVSVMDAQTV